MDSLIQHEQDICQQRLTRFLSMVDEVRRLQAGDSCLQEIMNSVSFQDTEAALETAIYNQRAALAR